MRSHQCSWSQCLAFGIRRKESMRFDILPLALATLCFGAVLAQEPDAAAAKQEKLAALKQSMAKNQAELKQYTWTETTQVSLKGEVKKQEQKQCQYGPDGKVQKTPLQGANPPPSEQGGGGRRRGNGARKKAVVEKKVGEMKEYMERADAQDQVVIRANTVQK